MDIKKEFSSLSQDMKRHLSPDDSFVSAERKRLLQTVALQRRNAPAHVESPQSAAFNMFLPKRLSFVAKPLMVSVMALLITSAGWIASVAAQGATSDEPLSYFVKRTSERIHVAVVPTKRKSAVKMEQAAERSEEVKKLTEKKNPEAKVHIEKTLADLDTLVQDVAKDIGEESDKQKKREDVKAMVDTMDVIALNLDEAKDEADELREVGGEDLDGLGETIGEISEKNEKITTDAVKEIVKDVEEGGTEEEKEEVREIVRDVVDGKIEKIEGSVEDLEEVRGELKDGAVEDENGNSDDESGGSIEEEEIEKIIVETREGVVDLNEATEKLLEEDKMEEAIDLVDREAEETHGTVERVVSGEGADEEVEDIGSSESEEESVTPAEEDVSTEGEGQGSSDE